MDENINFIAQDLLNTKREEAQGNFGLIKNFTIHGTDDVVLVTMRTKIETLHKLIDPLFSDSMASFWIYNTEILQAYIKNKTEIYDKPVFKQTTQNDNMTEEAFTRLWGSILDTDAGAV